MECPDPNSVTTGHHHRYAYHSPKKTEPHLPKTSKETPFKPRILEPKALAWASCPKGFVPGSFWKSQELG